uniref:RRP12-like protein n=1 Tax=Petromyzon marinus TaxID=7757 RepID=A0AAJ7TYY1_PETMA|nr:RRP12-like protein [Petromyzon marinus]
MARHGKLKAGVSSKVPRWKKGQSSSSNPATSRHRDAARSRFYGRSKGKSDLTVASLRLHDDIQSDPTTSAGPASERTPTVGPAQDAASERTAGTFLSGLSDITNATFGRVQRYWQSSSAAHKEICAVLAAVTEVIRSKGGTETETEYFAAFMTALETIESEESLAAVAYLLNMVIKRVPSSVLKKKFSDISKVFVDLMSTHTNSATSTVLRWILSCTAVLLRKQDLSVWADASTMNTFHALLSFATHTKPKVRRAGQQAVSAVIRGSEFMFADEAPPHHPAAPSTAKFCVREIEENGGTGDATATLHVLGLLKEVVPCLPTQSLKACCESVLRMLALGHVLVTARGMQALHALFAAQPKQHTLPAELNAQLITALYDYLPSMNDVQPMLAWLAVMESAHVNLARLNGKLCLSHLPRLVNSSMNCMLSDRSEVAVAAAQAIKTVLEKCVAPQVEDLGVLLKGAAPGQNTPVLKMFRAVEDGLKYRYHAAWKLVLQLLQTFFRVLGRQCHPIMSKCLVTLGELRASGHFAHVSELDEAIGAAVESMGPCVLLQALPLGITGTEETPDLSHSWLLPVMRDHIRNTEIHFFTSYFLPLAATFKSRALELRSTGKNLQAKLFDTLQWQVWSLLPGFFTNPVDLVPAFRGVARVLGTALTERPDLRMLVCQALRTLVGKGCSSDDERAEVGRFSKNFLPIFFNIYTEGDSSQGAPDGARLAVLETVKSFLSITDEQLICSFFEKASDKFQNPQTEHAVRLLVMDLVVVMTPFVDEAHLANIYATVLPHLQSRDVGMQKKAYRVVQEACAGERPACQNFVLGHLASLQEALLTSLRSTASPAKRPRLKCLALVVKQLSADREDFLTAIIPEVILCTKEVAVSARTSSLNLLAEIGHAFLRFQPDDKPEALRRYLALVYAGLAGSVTMISCTVLALTRILFEFKDHLEGSVLSQLLSNVVLLLSSHTRDVVKSALGFLKVVIFVTDVRTLAQHVQLIVEGIVNWRDDSRRHFRAKVKNIFTKLVRKFGYEMIDSMVPETYHKVLVNIRKAEERARKNRALGHAGGDDDDDDQDDGDADDAKSRRSSVRDNVDQLLADSDSEPEGGKGEESAGRGGKKAPKAAKAWLQEGEGDEPLDFLDPSVAQRVLATKPEQNQRSHVKHDFKFSSDGRLIIRDEEEEEEKMKKKKRGQVDEDEELADMMAEVGMRKNSSNRKRKLAAKDDDGDDGADEPRYKAGGSGIHRAVRGKKEAPGFGAAYKSKRAAGDVKRKGKPDPYAYVPLDKGQLNRRKRAKMQGQFKGLVKATKKGAAKGKRQNTRNKKHK